MPSATLVLNHAHHLHCRTSTTFTSTTSQRYVKAPHQDLRAWWSRRAGLSRRGHAQWTLVRTPAPRAIFGGFPASPSGGCHAALPTPPTGTQPKVTLPADSDRQTWSQRPRTATPSGPQLDIHEVRQCATAPAGHCMAAHAATRTAPEHLVLTARLLPLAAHRGPLAGAALEGAALWERLVDGMTHASRGGRI